VGDTIGYYMRDVKRLRKYTAPERAALIEAAYGSDASLHRRARHTLFHTLLWLPVRIARRYAYGAADLEDLVQAGNVAMFIALDSWKPGKGAKLLTWLRWGVERDVKREKDRAHVVRNSLLEVSYDTTDAATFDYARYGDTLGEQEAMIDPNASAEPQDELFQADTDVWVRVRSLDPQERDVIMALYFNAQSLREVAHHMQIAHMTVSRIRDSALSNLQRSYDND
jgi:RNA polymerase sigma factor (sigma-70 family)